MDLNSFLDTINSRRNNMRIIYAIDWVTIYRIFNKAFNELLAKIG